MVEHECVATVMLTPPKHCSRRQEIKETSGPPSQALDPALKGGLAAPSQGIVVRLKDVGSRMPALQR